MIPAEVFHPSEYIMDELKERGWSIDDLARKMGGDFDKQKLAMLIYIEAGPTDDGIRLGDAADLANALGISKEIWEYLENAWLDWRKRKA